MANKNAQPDEEIIDLTELIESGQVATPARSAATYAKAAQTAQAPAEPPDFEAMLAASEAGDASNARPVNPDEELDMSDMGDIDNLLESLDIPPQPRQVAPAPAPEASPKEMSAADLGLSDLDSMLDDLMPEVDAKPAAPAASAAASAPDLDDLLADSIPAQKPEPTDKALADLDADLDDIMAAVEPPAPAKPAPAPVLDDLDSLLDDPAPAPKAAVSDSESVLDDLDSLLDDSPDSQKVVSPAPQEATDDFDSLLEDAIPAPAQSEPDTPMKNVAPGQPAASVPAGEPVAEAVSMAAMAEEEFVLPQEAGTEMAMGDVVNEALNLQASSNGIPVSAAPLAVCSPEVIAGVYKEIMSGQESSSLDLLQKVSREQGSQTAHIDVLTRQTTDLEGRLRECEARLAASSARLDILEKGVADNAPLHEMLQEGGVIQQGLKSLVAEALSKQPPVSEGSEGLTDRIALLEQTQEQASQTIEELKSGLSSDQGNLSENMLGMEQRQSALESRLNDLSTLSEAVVIVENRVEQLEGRISEFSAAQDGRFAEMAADFEARLDELSKKMADLTSDFDARVEKAAAAAAARMLQEEIARLVAGE